jgi:putative flippase GtrA
MINGGVIDKLRRFKILSDILEPESFDQLKRYLITGFSSAAIEISLLYILKDLSGLSVIVSNSIALTIVFWFNFLMNRIWSFKSKNNITRQLVMYGILFVFNLAASDLIMYVLTSLLYLQYLIAKVFAIGAVVTWNFVLYKKVIYK